MGTAVTSPWPAVDALLDRAPGPDELEWHGLHLLAARRERAAGRPIEPALAREAQAARFRTLAVSALLARVREACDGRLLVLKGPEVAERYPEPWTRPFGDVDLLAEDADAAQRALLAAGFAEIGDPALYERIHHRRPLLYPGLPLPLELHTTPKWVPGLAPPEPGELFGAAAPGSGRFAGYLRPAPDHHAVLLAVHSWAHLPLRRLGDLLDVVLCAPDPAGAEAVAARWGCERVWRPTWRAAAAIYGDGSVPLALRIWGRHLPAVRHRTVFEGHLGRWLAPLTAAPPAARPAVLARALLTDVRPAAGEGWSTKLRRARRAAAAAGMPKADYDRRHEELSA